MQCLYCGKPLGLLKGFTDGEFCSREHRLKYKSLTQRAFTRLQEASNKSNWNNSLHAEPVPATHGETTPPIAGLVHFAGGGPCAAESYFKPIGFEPAGSLRVQAALVAPEFPARVARLKPPLATALPSVSARSVSPKQAAPVAAANASFLLRSPLNRLHAIRLETLDPPIWTWTREPGSRFVTEPASLPPRPTAAPAVPVKLNGSSMGVWNLKPVLAGTPDAREASVGLATAFDYRPPKAVDGPLPVYDGKVEPVTSSGQAVLPRLRPGTAQAVASAVPAMTPKWMPLAAPAMRSRGAVLDTRCEAATFVGRPILHPRLGIAVDRLTLKETAPLREEVLGADMAGEAVALPQQHVSTLGTGNVLPALASLFRYSRASRPAPPMSHVAEGMAPQNRRASPAAFLELPMSAKSPVIPRTTGLRIVETFEYLRPMERPPFDLWQALMQLWGRSPVYLRFATAAACLMLLVWSAWPGAGVLDVMASRMGVLREGIGRRAAVELSEDFQGGMTEWSGSGDWANSWRSSKAGYVKPGRLALYRPSMQMREYNVDFLMQIDEKALGFAYRATDEFNYYAAKISIQKAGPLPELALVRYPVIGGQAGARVEIPIRMVAHNNTPYRVRLTVSERGYSTSIEGQLVDFWSDDRLTSGGFGFFTDAGESARVYWMKLEHQTDVIGRVCAYFYTADVDRRNTRKPQ